MAKDKIDYPVVAIGRPTKYTEKVKQYVEDHKINNVTFIHQSDFSDFPAIYQMATMFVYPSIFEGFGIPILEALNSGTPVITTKGGVFPEVGGDAALYVEYGNTAEMSKQIQRLLGDEPLRQKLATKGKQQALKFRKIEIAANLMNVYRKLVK
jgi:glycosyltransferase involved in cell wall biosynthesis